MKDLPHHVKQLNRKVIRSTRREEEQEQEYDKAFRIEESERQKKKKEKIQKRKEKKAHVPHPQTADERNDLMNERTPVRKERSHHPKGTPFPKDPNQSKRSNQRSR